MKFKYLFVLFLIAGLFLLQTTSSIAGATMRYKNIKDVPVEKWQELSGKRIYFGHQSIGYNIIDGLHDIMKHDPNIKLNIVEGIDASRNVETFWVHSRVGQNMRPDLKVKDFVIIIDNEFGGKVDVAFLKLCYGDINSKSDIRKIFENYKNGIELIKKKYPNIVVIHFTVPLTVIRESWKIKIKGILRREVWEYADNIKRNEFNGLMRKEYGDSGLLFDIARLEATAPDGKRQIFKYKNKKYNSMVKMYSDDGGHLNGKGRKIIAKQLLVFLVNQL